MPAQTFPAPRDFTPDDVISTIDTILEIAESISTLTNSSIDDDIVAFLREAVEADYFEDVVSLLLRLRS